MVIDEYKAFSKYTFDEIEEYIRQEDARYAEACREAGFPWKAKYIEMFGSEYLNPGFWEGDDDLTEEFYKKYVKKGKPYDKEFNGGLL